MSAADQNEEQLSSKEDLKPLPPGIAGWGLKQSRRGIESWIGTTEKPLVYKTELAAKIAARLLDARMNWPGGRTRAARYEPDEMHRVEDFKPPHTAEEALTRLERGHIL